jgi:hypothetical protein
MSDKLKNTWKQLKSNMSAGDEVIKINKEVKSRANKAPWYKEPTVGDLQRAYKDAHKNSKKK